MRVKILGSAAGGGFPQWNCACANCKALRAGTFASKPRTQTQVAISHDGRSWFLLGASPDLRSQIEATSELHAGRVHDSKVVRQSPITGIVLANADLDHVLGLLLLRELQPLHVHATTSIRKILCDDNSMFGMLHRVRDQISWEDFSPGEWFPLCDASGNDSGLRCRALSLGLHYPAYVSQQRQSTLAPGQASLGLMIETPGARRLAFLPAVPQIDDALLRECESSDILLFDGTFWSDDEMIRLQGSGNTARHMGHVPISSADGSLNKLAVLERPRKIFLHINNTNPVLNEAGPEHQQARDAGWEIAEDGWQFDL